MTLRVKILCDGEYQHGLCVNQILLKTPEEHARQQAHRVGWLTRGERHYCPDCTRAGRHNQAVTR